MTPDYIIIGAMKCGTSTLAAQLGAQAGIFMTSPKEPNFFSDDAVYARGLDWYANLFAAAGPDDIKGEASTHYTKLPDHPQTVARLASATGGRPLKLIYLIRNPLERAMSHYIHEWTQGVIRSDFATALREHPALVRYGCYGEQAAPWVAQFGLENLLVLSLEQIKHTPQQVFNQVGAFLGRDNLIWQEDLKQVNVSAERVRRVPFQGLLIDNTPARWVRRSLVPQALRDRVKASRRLRERPEFPETARQRLETVFAADYAVLRDLVGNRHDLDLSYPFL